MNRRFVFLSLIFVIGVWALVACAGEGSSSNGAGESAVDQTGTQSVDGEAASLTPEAPEEYAGLQNPLEGEPGAVDSGRQVYQVNCDACHGKTGQGDGPAAGGMEPAPTNLAQAEGNLSDGYLFWRIKEGGMMPPFNSTMPAWGGILTDEQIWQVITYLRTLG